MMRIFVTEFADSKREIERELKPKTENIIEHLFKLYLVPEHTAVNHWKQEIYFFLHTIDKLKGNNKRPSKKQLYDWTFGKKEDLFDDDYYTEGMIETIEYTYNVNITADTFEVNEAMFQICKSYFAWLAEILSEKGIVVPRQVYNKLDELL